MEASEPERSFKQRQSAEGGAKKTKSRMKNKTEMPTRNKICRKKVWGNPADVLNHMSS